MLGRCSVSSHLSGTNVCMGGGDNYQDSSCGWQIWVKAVLLWWNMKGSLEVRRWGSCMPAPSVLGSAGCWAEHRARQRAGQGCRELGEGSRDPLHPLCWGLTWGLGCQKGMQSPLSLQGRPLTSLLVAETNALMRQMNPERTRASRR